MSNSIEREKQIIYYGIENMNMAKDISNIIDNIKEKKINKIIFTNESNNDQICLNITPEIKDEFIFVMTHIKNHCKTLAESKLSSVRNAVKNI